MKSLKYIPWGPHDSRARQIFFFFLLNLVLYLFCLYLIVSESLISIFLCKACFNNKVSWRGREDPWNYQVYCLYMNHHIPYYEGIQKNYLTNFKPQGVPTAPQQQLTWMEPALPSSGVGQWPQRDGLFLQNTSCRKVYLKVLGKPQNVI